MDMNKNRHINAKYRETQAPPPDYRSSDDDIHPRIYRGIIFWCCLVLVGVVIVSGAIVAVLLASKGKNKNKNGGDDFIFPPPPPASPIAPPAGAPLNYSRALSVALRFYDAQKSGKLPADNPIAWRGDSAISDGLIYGYDLAGGYYDAGDHVKYTFPMAFSMTMLAWSMIEYPAQFAKATAMDEAMDALKWGTDWLLKTWNVQKNELVAQVGNVTADHECWVRPESMGEERPVYTVTGQNLGTDLVCEVAAALAAASIIYKPLDQVYWAKLTQASEQLWTFGYGTKVYSTYSASIPEAGIQYPSTNYTDEFLWAASWLYRASNNSQYLSYATAYVFEEDWTLREVNIVSWDQKMLGARLNLLLATEKVPPSRLPGGSKNGLVAYRNLVERSMCRFLFDNPLSFNETWRTNGQLLYLDPWSPNQYAAGAAYVAGLYAGFLNRTNAVFNCSTPDIFTSTDLRVFARYQIDYILGKNPLKQSYMVGWGTDYPQQVHHTGASIPDNGALPTCGPTGDYWLNINQSNPNIINGALVGGPDQADRFNDSRPNYRQTEPSLSMQSAFVAALAAVGSLYP